MDERENTLLVTEMTDRQLLVVDGSRTIPRAQIFFVSGDSVTMINDTMINVNELAEYIWSREIGLQGKGPPREARKNYINAVKRKSLRLDDHGILPRLPPMDCDSSASG